MNFDEKTRRKVNAHDFRYPSRQRSVHGCPDDTWVKQLTREIKDRRLTVREVRDTLRTARDQGVAEIVFVIRGGIEPADAADYQQLCHRQFQAGHNVYDVEFEVLLRVCLILFGEVGRRELLEAVGRRIDMFGDLADRQAWRDLLIQQ